VVVEAAQALAETLEAGKRALLGGFVEGLVGTQARAEPYRLAQAVKGVDLFADDARDLTVE
jgi:hypothetical protein